MLDPDFTHCTRCTTSTVRCCFYVLMYWPTNCVKQMMAYVHLPPSLSPSLPLSLPPPVTVISRCHCVAPGRSAYSGGKTETVSLPYALLHNSPESCETGCSIVNYPKGQTQHLFSPCSPWDELTDPQTYRPLSADRKDQLFAAPESPENGAPSRIPTEREQK